jgi:hypothetical protein
MHVLLEVQEFISSLLFIYLTIKILNYIHHFVLPREGYELLLLGNAVQTKYFGLQN